MTNQQILRDLCLDFTLVKKEISTLKCAVQTPETMSKIAQLRKLRDNIKNSIIDLKGAIACGADDEHPLRGWL